MIQPTSNSYGSSRAGAISQNSPKPAAPKPTQQPATDTLSTPNAESLRRALASTPEIRPEVVERAKKLAADPSYPPKEIIDSLAKLFTDSADPSEVS